MENNVEIDSYNNLVENLKLLSKSNCPVELSRLTENIKKIIRSVLINNFSEEINDKITRDKVTKLLVDLLNSVKIKNKGIVIIACNELNNTSEIIDDKDLVVNIAIELGQFIHKLIIHTKQQINS